MKKYHPCTDSIMKKNQVKYRKNVIQKYMERMRRRNYKALLTALETSLHLFLMAVGDCIVNKKSQAEVATKYNIPRSRIQRAMSGKKEHRKGGKQYQQEKKRKPSEEDSTRSLKIRRNERELKRIDYKPTLDIEGQNSKEDRDEQLDVQLYQL